MHSSCAQEVNEKIVNVMALANIIFLSITNEFNFLNF